MDKHIFSDSGLYQMISVLICKSKERKEYGESTVGRGKNWGRVTRGMSTEKIG